MRNSHNPLDFRTPRGASTARPAAQALSASCDEGGLPVSTNPELVARYLMTVANGIAVQASGGVGRDELQEIADMTLLTWPDA